jgi:hypothetical protein
MATKNDDTKPGKGNTPVDPSKSGNAGNNANNGRRKGFDEQHGARGSQLNANTTGNTGKSKHRGA